MTGPLQTEVIMPECSSPAISLLIATRNRASRLLALLRNVADQECVPPFEVIAVNNGSKDATEEILRQRWRNFALVCLFEETAGKSRALNRALDVARGSLLVFTDDDVVVSAKWLSSLYEASLRFHSADVFCGPIIPDYPPQTPVWLQENLFAGIMFASFQPKIREGLLPKGYLPFGANFAVRSCAMDTKRFKLELGPSYENGPSFFEDTELLQRFRDESREFVFIPEAHVWHHVSPDRIQTSFLFERAFHFGRGDAMYRKKPRYLHLQRGGSVYYVDGITQEARFEHGGLLNYYCGQLSELRRLGERSFEGDLVQVLDQLGVRANVGLLCRSARQVLEGPQ
jgi:glycosyltransferase involved in cell wall biosynthesis